MPLASVAAQNASLDNDYGTTRGPNAPGAHELALFNGDPVNGGTELTGFGYARASVLPADWIAADDGAKSATVTFAAPTAAWLTATHWLLIDAADSTTFWESAAFDEALEVTGAGAGPEVTVTVFYPF
jgi:hypothetical protein